MKAGQFVCRVVNKVKVKLADIRFYKIASGYNLCGHKRLYLIHIRKTGGTSLNNMFLSLSGGDPASLYNQLAAAPGYRLLSGGMIYVGWDVDRINKGNYFYGFSHAPLHKLDLPEGTFTITCFRDPVKRVVSHYRMLLEYRENNIDHPCMEIEGKWLGECFDDFLQRIPKQHLLNQFYMFSDCFDVDQAVEQVEKLSHYFFTDDFNNGIESLNRKTGLDLLPIHARKTTISAQITDESLARLGEMMAEEYRFLERIRK